MKEVMMVLCPHCQSDQVIKGGKTEAGKQRYKCQNVDEDVSDVLICYPFWAYDRPATPNPTG